MRVWIADRMLSFLFVLLPLLYKSRPLVVQVRLVGLLYYWAVTFRLSLFINCATESYSTRSFIFTWSLLYNNQIVVVIRKDRTRGVSFCDISKYQCSLYIQCLFLEIKYKTYYGVNNVTEKMIFCIFYNIICFIANFQEKKIVQQIRFYVHKYTQKRQRLQSVKCSYSVCSNMFSATFSSSLISRSLAQLCKPLNTTWFWLA